MSESLKLALQQRRAAMYAQLLTLFEDCEIRDLSMADDRMSFRVVGRGESDREFGPRFEQLEKLSQVLRTKLINLTDSGVDDSGCDTCGHGRTFGFTVRIEGATLPALYPCQFQTSSGPCGAEGTNVTKRFCDTHAPMRCVSCGAQGKMFNASGSPCCHKPECRGPS